MPTKTFSLNLIDGHPIIEENDNVILIDTGSPVTIHTSSKLNFMNYDFNVREAYGGVTIPHLCDLIGTRINTLLGMDKLQYYKIIFDYPNNRITFSNNNELVFEGEQIEIKKVLGIPTIEAIVNGNLIPCFFDTGAKLSYLPAEETLNYENQGDVSDFYPGIGSFQSPTYNIETRIGGNVFPVVFGNLPKLVENQLLRLINGKNGIIGYDFLKKYKISMDLIMGQLNIAASSPDNACIPDDSENDLPDWLKWDSLRKNKLDKP